jgi:TonB family protein
MKKETKKNQILHRPEFPGGRKALLQTITDNLQYPERAREANIKGTVRLRYGINYKGEVVDVKVVKGIGYGCDEEAIRLVKLLKFNVDKTRGIKVLFHRTIQIHFHPPQKAVGLAGPQTNEATAPAVTYHYTSTAKPVEQKGPNRTIHYQLPIKQD